MKRFAALLLLLWAGVIVITYYVVQKPSLLTAFTGLVDTVWTLLVAAILLFNAYGLGKRILRLLRFDSQDLSDHLLLSFGIGLGALGLLALFFSMIQLANKNILTVAQMILASFYLLRNDSRRLYADLNSLRLDLRLSFSQYNIFTKVILISLLTFTFLLTLVPPFEAFDALSYHLVQPSQILQDGGLHAVDIPAFWYPSLAENVYLWSLAMQSERGSQLIHFVWALLAVLLLWHWVNQGWNNEIGRKTLLLVSSLASLPMLASWAYVDMALVYYAIAALYTLRCYERIETPSWLSIVAVMSGFAMSVKYTSFVIPLVCALLIVQKRFRWESIKSGILFSTVALLTALPWYLRNLFIMHNPFYPFIFNGLYWDSFRGQWYANAHTGIGWNVLQIILIPINMTLGTHELSAADGRVGPLFLILLPMTLWIFIKYSHRNLDGSESLKNIATFIAISFLAWVLGVINSAMLWQVRFFYPALILLAIPTALGWDLITKTGSRQLQMWLNIIVAVTLVVNVFETAFFVLQRNPLAYAFGVQSRMRYLERVNPSYAALIEMIDQLPQNAKLYSLYEPRSYAMPRRVQPDLVLYNFSDDLFLYKSPQGIIQHWKAANYTHILVYERGLRLMTETETHNFPLSTRQQLMNTLRMLQLVRQTPDKLYSVYRIP